MSETKAGAHVTVADGTPDDGQPVAPRAPFFKAHMLLLRWGKERLARECAEASQTVEPAPASERGNAADRPVPSLLEGTAPVEATSAGDRFSHCPNQRASAVRLDSSCARK